MTKLETQLRLDWFLSGAYRRHIKQYLMLTIFSILSLFRAMQLFASLPDNFEDHDAVIALRSGGEEVNNELEKEIRERLQICGIEVIEARINYIAYAEEIANAMLRRQQATAVVAARFKIVEGAVSMVEMALEQLSVKKIVELDEEKKAAMVSNLMVVLCGDKDATPIVNTGTLHN
jgi:hypothetical protein